jgi:hypothetical protein
LFHKGEAVTIIAGFKSYEGIVICADTQETMEHSKRQVPKLRFEPADHDNGSTDDLAAAFCGSSNDGPWVDKLIENAWESAQVATSLDEACDEVEKSIKRTYKEFGHIYQPGCCPTAELIYGVKMFNRTKLFSAYGPVVNEKEGFYSSGIGYYMADFLAGRMYEHHLNIRQCVILAAYILFQTKEHVEGCGGDSHIAVLREEGTSGRVGWQQVEAITEILKYSDKEIGRTLLQLADLDLNDEQFKEHTNLTLEITAALREHNRKRLKESEEMNYCVILGDKPREIDSLGLVNPSPSEKSESEE